MSTVWVVKVYYQTRMEEHVYPLEASANSAADDFRADGLTCEVFKRVTHVI